MRNVLLMVEEFFGLTPVQDITQSMLVKNKYAASYNVPYDQSIVDVANYSAGDTYDADHRAVLFK